MLRIGVSVSNCGSLICGLFVLNYQILHKFVFLIYIFLYICVSLCIIFLKIEKKFCYFYAPESSTTRKICIVSFIFCTIFLISPLYSFCSYAKNMVLTTKGIPLFFLLFYPLVLSILGNYFFHQILPQPIQHVPIVLLAVQPLYCYTATFLVMNKQ